MLNNEQLHLYVREVENYATFALDTYEQLLRSLQAGDARVFRHVHGFLAFATCVAKIIGAGVSRGEQSRGDQSPGDQSRGDQICTVLFTRPASALKLARRVRNHFEHFDERLDRIAQGPARMVVDSNIVIGARIEAGVSVADALYLRNLRADQLLQQLAVSYAQDEVNLDEVRAVLDELRQAARDWLARHNQG